MHDDGGLRVVDERCRLDTDALRELVRRLDGYRTSTDLGAAWKRGVPRGWLDALVADWRVFDSDALQMRLDALRQQRAEVAGIALHVVHAEGRGPSPLPLLVTHGWPGSFLEYLPILLCFVTRERTAQTPPTRSPSSFRHCLDSRSAGRRADGDDWPPGRATVA